MYKKIAAFVAGAAAIEVINHTVLMTNNLLPMHVLGYVVSREANSFILVGWILVFVVSAYYSWIKKA